MTPTHHDSYPAESRTVEPLQLALWRGADRWLKRIQVPSVTTPEHHYTIGIDVAGQLGCSCPAWIYDSRRRPCKHIQRYLRSKGARS